MTDVDGRLLDGEYVGFPGSNFVNVVPRPTPVVRHRVPAAPKVNARLILAEERAAMAAHRAAVVAARHHR